MFTKIECMSATAHGSKKTKIPPLDMMFRVTSYSLMYPFVRNEIYVYNSHTLDSKLDMSINNKYSTLIVETQSIPAKLEKMLDLYILNNCVEIRKKILKEDIALSIDTKLLNTAILTVKHSVNPVLRKDEIHKLLTSGGKYDKQK